MRTRGWMAGFHDAFDEMGQPLHELIAEVEGDLSVDQMYVQDMEMLRGIEQGV